MAFWDMHIHDRDYHILNPAPPEFKKISFGKPEPLAFDFRLLN
jgi:hypothetical protein